jgi:hypothetical protein
MQGRKMGGATIIYLAEYTFNSYGIASVEVIHETEKQYQVDEKSRKNIAGSKGVYVPSRINKKIYAKNIFLTLLEAQLHLLDLARQNVVSVQQRLERVTALMVRIEDEIEAEKEARELEGVDQ